ncbi:hypothetical protein DWV00_12590 [Trinickia dinghuensis]|uniref:Uncharacterized protein n=2 Tax=Trinickia dinghuensis TaxID=2291023 RepID=A0A3D8JZ57_9BURK|nr:hypothetical protein DWV00_12590 [Trinickia dinghuensis]
MHDRPRFVPFDDEEDDWSPDANRLRHLRARDNHDSYVHSDANDTVPPCPACDSPRTAQRHIARRIFGAMGAAAGASGAIAAALSGAEVGAAVGIIAGPLGAACGGFAGAILAGLVAGAAGCATGAAFGEALDVKVLNNWRCLACGCTFTVRPD